MNKASGSSADKILYLLKTQGPMTTKGLAAELSMTPMGARQHLLQLRELELLESFERIEKVGRPSQYWRLLPKANERFPDAHNGLACSFISAARAVFGDDGLTQVLAQRQQNLCEDYRQTLDPLPTLADKLSMLVELRNREGYLAQWQPSEQGGYLFIENHCPIREAASSCDALCGNELALFRSCLGTEVEIERTEHLLEGARRCAYSIKPMEVQ